MKNLKGKCKTCFGCNLLSDEQFQGKNKCKYYIRAEKSWFMVITAIIELTIIGLAIYGLYMYFARLIGG